MEEENVRGLDNSEEEGEIRWCNNREGKTSCCIVVEDIGVCVCVCVCFKCVPTKDFSTTVTNISSLNRKKKF